MYDSTDGFKERGNDFDIIVVADSNNKLNEAARAIRRAGDTYFPSDTLFEAWELKYCIDNDTDRFAWADSENGKGVIYYLKDEWNNEAAYDFKSITFCNLNTAGVDTYNLANHLEYANKIEKKRSILQNTRYTFVFCNTLAEVEDLIQSII